MPMHLISGRKQSQICIRSEVCDDHLISVALPAPRDRPDLRLAGKDGLGLRAEPWFATRAILGGLGPILCWFRIDNWKRPNNRKRLA